MIQPSIFALAVSQAQLAENPLWHPGEGCLYWTDILGGTIHRLDLATSVETTVYRGPTVGGFTLQKNGDLLLFRVNDVVILRPDGSVLGIRNFSDSGMERFNDVIADPQGRVFAGTIGSEMTGGLYRMDIEGTITKLFSGTGCSNGMGFSPDHRTFYWTCSSTRRIFQFDYDEKTGEIGNRQLFYRATDSDGIPDGLTVDAEGCIWSAHWNGDAMLRHGPDGTILCRIPIPAHRVTSVCFGGDTLDQLFITAAQDPSSGMRVNTLFQMPATVRGLPEFKSKIGLSLP